MAKVDTQAKDTKASNQRCLEFNLDLPIGHNVQQSPERSEGSVLRGDRKVEGPVDKP